MRYVVQYGDGQEHYLPDDYSMAVDYITGTIMDIRLPNWRRDALLTQAENMPRAGFSFTDSDGILVRVERVA